MASTSIRMRATYISRILPLQGGGILSFQLPKFRCLQPLPQVNNSLANRQFSNTSIIMADNFLSAIESRRTYYQLENSSPVSDDRIHEIVKQVFLNTPSAFNSQSTRVLVLLGDEHEKLWRDIVKPAVKAVAPAEAWEGSEKRLSGFQSAYGTALFYEDPQTVAALQNQYKLYAEKFPQWSEHTNGAHAVNLWTALEQEGFGANLQHYNPLIDQQVSSKWDVPQDWSLKAQLVFGKPVGQPGEKSFKPLEDRLFVHGGKFGSKN